ncbi:RHS repeat-associated core domain-containing protein [Amycolatopsis cihanbeyliensis]|uniref:RHS repeat-associated protein n=1 Tax=Amycolatopsis cihanbeyliensis TaxID=1128664 RepID=A0A542CUN5_AMYCI|nr:RHS repeat-associated core domain-containing protein [Amycolatopsis cihanbeyliensis]TQI94537.1 RHS repeat-associated protein [Amycolatopsis cihanbeyliensis]
MAFKPTLRALALLLGIAVGSTTVVAVAEPENPSYVDLPELQQERSVPGEPVRSRPLPTNPVDEAAAEEMPEPRWPEAATADLALAPVAAARSSAEALPRSAYRQAGELPVSVALQASGQATARSAAESPSVRVETFGKDRAEKSGVDGVLLAVSNNTGAAGETLSVRVDYSGFASAYGGDYGSRLRIRKLPECALHTPEKPECRAGEPIRTDNHAGDRQLTADVPLPRGAETPDARSSGASPVLLAVQAAPSGAGGSFEATKLSPAGSWSAGGSSGDFTYSVPLRVPPPTAGTAPRIGLGYSSGSVDGRTSATNNQASTVGDGWELSTGGFIERRYKACSEDLGGNQGQRKTGDLCWATDNAVLSLNGISAELVRDGDSGMWRPKNDDGSRIERLTGATNGDNNGEYWKVTGTDGTQYFLGRNRLPGWQSGKPETNSAFTVPVFGNNSGEPCYQPSFGDSWCQQAYRWNLDYVVDPNGNVTTYFYDTETNRYGRDQDAGKQTEYVAGGSVRRIEYGLRSDAVYAPAPARVWFDTAERCLPKPGLACEPGELNEDTAESWPDVPFDRICAPGDRCENQHSPSFFSRKRLVKVLTQVRTDDVDGAARWKDVDSWTLRHQFPDTGDGLSPSLWLAGITHTGLVGGRASVPEMVFHGRALPNRVDTGDDNLPPITRYRIERVVNEAGGVTEVEYSDRECVAGSNIPDSPEHNAMRCFPAWWVPEFGYERVQSWFHKYVVTAVTEDGRTGGSELQKTFYEYKGGAAWHFDQAEFTDMKYRTWSQWRGYGLVRTITGEPGTTQSITEERFLRGMDGDHLPGGGERSVQVTDSEGGKVTDRESLAGFSRETLQYEGDELVSASIKDPWVHGPTATSGEDKAYRTNVERVRGRTLLSDGSWRRTELTTTFDDYGNAIRVEDLGDTGKTGDETCSRTTYARNMEKWILTRPSTVRVVGLPCSAGEGGNEDVISDVRSSYDGQEHGAAPTKGNLTAAERWNGTEHEPTQSISYDALGRQTEVENALGQSVRTSYEPASGFLVREITETNSLGQTGVTTYEPAWAQPVTDVGVSGERADLEYDPLGRLTKAWAPGRSKVDDDSASSRFEYEYRTDAPTVVTTHALREDGDYNTSYTLFDGLLRERQSQIPAVSGGRVVTGWLYDSRGQQHRVNNAYYNENAPDKQVLGVKDNAVPNQTLTEFDALGRETAVIYRKLGVEQWRTSSSYGGDRVTVVPPRGDTTTTVLKDVQDRVVERRQHHEREPSSDYDTTRYDYNPAGQIESMTGPDGAQWSYEYDVLGRKVVEHDPDSGTSRYTYDALDQRVTSTDARGFRTRFEYDAMGRKVAEYERKGTGEPEVKTASWSYDGLKPGLLDSATRWVDGNAYTQRVDSYDDALRPTKNSVVIPEVEGNLAGTYEFRTSYNRHTGKVDTRVHPEAGGLDAEAIFHDYNELGLPTETFGIDTYAQEHLYSKYGETLRLKMGDGANTVYTSMFYQEGTRRLDAVDVQRNSPEGAYLAKRGYDYDPAGNITRIADTPPGQAGDVQCFSYDYLQRLTRGFTPANGDCGQEPSVGALGGAAPYWHDYEYDKGGNRTKEIQHGAEGDTVRTYEYGAEDGSQPHTLRSVTQTGPQGTSKDTYGYDAAGNMTSRNVSGSPQELEWDARGRTATVTEHDGRESEYLYDADGDRLIKRESGITTLYLDGMELVLQNTTEEVTGKRYYAHGGQNVAVRTSDEGLSFLLGDHQGTASMSVDADTLEASTRRQDPFGVPRGEQPDSWPDDKGFVGGIKDETGLTNLGARQYEPENGRFVSVDPIIDRDEPQQMNGYAYANNSPVTNSDPNGLYWKTLTVAKKVAITKIVVTTLWLLPFLPVLRFVAVTIWVTAVFTYRVWIEPPWQPAGSSSSSPEQRAVAEAGLSRQEYEEAKKLANDQRSWLDVAVHHGGEIVKELVSVPGIIEHCIDNFNLLSCAGEVITALPIGKIFKAGTIAKKVARGIGSAIDWSRKRDRAREKIRAVQTAKERLTKSGCNSFVPGTLVLMADGSERPVEELELGDRVLATDPETGESVPREVVATIVGEGAKNLVEVTVAGEHPGVQVPGTVVATEGHPFWVSDLGEWVPAGQLEPGMWLRTGSGSWVQVTGIESWTATRTVHNLTIDTDHTYYVAAGATTLLNHNCPDGAPGKRKRAADLPPDKNASGSHTVFERGQDGKVTRYQTWKKNDQHPAGWEKGPRFRGTGDPHAGIGPPIFYPKGGGKAFPATGENLPRGY